MAERRPRLLDLFCGAGGCAVGYARAGFDIKLGVDIRPQPNYPYRSHEGDALDFLRRAKEIRLDFDAIHASPPCQGYLNLGGVNRALGRAQEHERLIAQVRELLVATGLPYVIENVADAGSELREPVRLCGSSFRLPLRRHRLFECSFPVVVPSCDHAWQTEKRYWTGWRPNGERRLSTVVQVYGNAGGKEHWPEAMGIDWMTDDEMAEAVPPAYTEHIGHYLRSEIDARARLAA